MLIDGKTRRDLEIFQTRDGSPGIFDLLNLARTRGGTAALRSRFESPISDPAALTDTQDGIRFLLEEGVKLPAQPKTVEAVARYLDSSWDVASDRRGILFLVESTFVGLRYRDLLRYAREGVDTTQRLVEQIIPALEDLLTRDPPSWMRGFLEEFLQLALQIRPDRPGSSLGPWGVFRRDRALRRERRAEFRAFLDRLFEMDALLAMAEGVDRHGLVFPEILTGPDFEMQGEGLFHLFLDAPVANPVRMSGEGNLLFLTGPNMAGKTTYLKTVALSAYLAHLGMGVPASHLRITPLDALFSSIAPEENIREGLSYFMAEVRRVREVAESLSGGSRALVLFDEVFRGTNVRDAYDASLLVIRGFARNRGCGFLFSSHLVELADELEGENGIRFNSFEGTVQEGRAVYTFKINQGVSDQRFGLQLLEEEGVPRLLRSWDP